jgi:hypothetical protein
MIIIAFIVFSALWFLGIGVVAYHIKKYSLPGDKLLFSFWIFLGISALTFFGVISFIFGAI